MLLKFWRFLTILLTALTMALSVCHLMEMPQRLKFDAELWVRVTVFENIFKYFGSVGAIFEMGAVLTSIVLIFLVRQRGAVIFYLTLGGALCVIAAFVVWLSVVAPANTEFAGWLTKPIPTDFAGWRKQWEYGHAARAVMHIIGLSLLLWSIIIETPKTLIERKDL